MNTQTVNKSVKPERRYDVDWLRVLAVLLLFPYHTARIFDTFDNFYVKNDQLSQALTYIIAYANPWHMPLLFLLAGAATYFALRFRSGGQYALERFKRLLVRTTLDPSYSGIPASSRSMPRTWTAISWVGSRSHICGLSSTSSSSPWLRCRSSFFSEVHPGKKWLAGWGPSAPGQV
jgi:hypothetical protein